MRRVSLLRLIVAFAWTGISSLGGGRSAYFHDVLVRRRGWIRHDEFVADFTLSQVLPGPNFSNLSVVLGHRLAGLAGGAWGLVSVVLPGAVILVALGALYLGGAFSPSLTLLMRSLSAAVVGLVAITTLRIVRGSLRGGRAFAVAALTFGVACLNVGALVAAWWSGRRRELLTRIAIGGSRFQVVRGLLVETALWAGVGVAGAVPVALGCVAVVAAIVTSPDSAFDFAPRIDARAVAVGIGLFGLFVLGAALAPARPRLSSRRRSP